MILLKSRWIKADFKDVKKHFQDLYLGEKRDFTGYINDEPWLAENGLLGKLAEKYTLAIVSGAPKREISYTLKKNHALGYFSAVWGMHQCKGKKDGLEKAIARFEPDEVFFCDDRPSPIKEAKEIGRVHAYGILPPQGLKNWPAVLKKAGAERVFKNVNEYCQFLLGLMDNKPYG